MLLLHIEVPCGPIIKKLNDEEQTKLQSIASVWIEMKKNAMDLL